MPVYVHKCLNGHQFDIFKKMEDYNDPDVCKCGAESKRITVPTMLSPDIQPWDAYVSPATGKYITSYKDRRKDMEESGCVDYEPSLRTNSKSVIEQEEAKLEKELDATVEKTIEEMPSEKKEKLYNEMKNSTLEYERL